MTSAGHITIAGDGWPMVTIGAIDFPARARPWHRWRRSSVCPATTISTGDTKPLVHSDGAAGVVSIPQPYVLPEAPDAMVVRDPLAMDVEAVVVAIC
jgi:hypothetical protein